MKFTISKKDLLNALKLALINPAERVKDYALITCNPRENRITLQSTDGAMHLKSFIPIEPGGVSGSAILPIGTTILALSCLPKSVKICTLTRVNDVLRVTADDGVDALVLPVIETADNFPDFPKYLNTEEAMILRTSGAELATLLDRVTYALPKTGERENLRFILLESYGNHTNYSLTATDGYRLARAAGYADCRHQTLEQTPLLLPIPCVRILRKMLVKYTETVISRKDNFCAISCGAHLLVCPSAAKSSYPDYRQIIPADPLPSQGIRVSRAVLMDALKRLLPHTSRPDHGVLFSVRWGVLILSTQEDGSTETRLEVFYKGSAKRFDVNARYVLDALKNIPGDSVVLEDGWDEDPVRIRTNNPDTLILIKPLRCPVRAA